VTIAAPDWPLETERLALRPYEEGDFGAYHAIRALPEVSTYLYDGPLGLAEAREKHTRLVASRGLEAEGDWLPAVIGLRDSGTMVGDVGLHWASVQHRTGEVGFVLDPAHQGHGYATEAARAMIGWGFGTFGLHRMIGRTEARNTASARVLEKLGMRLEAHLVENEWVKGEWQSELVYAILDREWNS
jgi:RimJ/RimL family protein N-acetyltransferase